MRHTTISLTLARAAVSCNLCFTGSGLSRAGIGVAQPFSIGAKYRPGGVVVVGINPGAAKDGGYKEARKQALDRFTAGDDSALTDYGLLSQRMRSDSGTQSTWPDCANWSS